MIGDITRLIKFAKLDTLKRLVNVPSLSSVASMFVVSVVLTIVILVIALLLGALVSHGESVLLIQERK